MQQVTLFISLSGRSIWLSLFLVSLTACVRDTAVVQFDSPPSIAHFQSTINAPQLRLRVQGAEIMTAAGQPIQLRGIAFGNEVWLGDKIPKEHHQEQDFIRIKAAGFNSIRFYLNYQMFESDNAPFVYKQAAWEWLDQNVAWAEQHGVYLILNMHVPQGGYQSQGEGDALWDDPIQQLRLKRLWQAIASRYQSSPYVAGFDLVNEPMTTRNKQQWFDLASQLVAEIREVNQQQIIFVERLLGVKGEWREDAEQNFFKLDDPNIVYQYHFYHPISYTHQQASWLPNYPAPRHYPDPDRYQAGSELKWQGIASQSSYLDTHSLRWQGLESSLWRAPEDSRLGIVPALVVRDMPGQVEFKQLQLKRYPPGSKSADKVSDLPLDASANWYFWRQSGRGAFNYVQVGNEPSVTVGGTDSDANLNNWNLLQALQAGYAYQITGMARVKQASEGQVQLRLDKVSSPQPILAWGPELLAAEVARIEAWAKQQQVPVYLGEFGCIRSCFTDGAGGLDWVRDMLHILQQRGSHYNYHAYHEHWFGLYQNAGLPTEDGLNQDLLQVFMDVQH